MKVIIRSLALICLVCIISGLPLASLIFRLGAITNELNEAVNLVNTTFGIDDWVVTPPYRSDEGYFNFGTYPTPSGVHVEVYPRLEKWLGIDLNTHVGTDSFGFEEYIITGVYPYTYSIIKNSNIEEGVILDALRLKVKGTYRSGFLGFVERTVEMDVYYTFEDEEVFYYPNGAGDALSKIDLKAPFSAVEENTTPFTYSARENALEEFNSAPTYIVNELIRRRHDDLD